MIRFKNELLENVCKEMLTPEDYELKVVSGTKCFGGGYMIAGNAEILRLIRVRIENLEHDMALARKAETLTLLALQLGGEVEETH